MRFVFFLFLAFCVGGKHVFLELMCRQEQTADKRSWYHKGRTFFFHYFRTVMVVILWYLDIQLPMQLVSITTNVVISNSRTWRDILDTTLCDKVS